MIASSKSANRGSSIPTGRNKRTTATLAAMPGGDFTHLGVGCSDTYFASQSAEQGDLGSRAWINPFTGVFPSNARDHTGHTHTGTSHKMLVESDDLNQTMNPGATYYAELVYVTPDEYAWCQTHPGECNMSNNASYLRYNVSGTTNFTFSAVGFPVRMAPPSMRGLERPSSRSNPSRESMAVPSLPTR